jgi:hypothetical protein
VKTRAALQGIALAKRRLSEFAENADLPNALREGVRSVPLVGELVPPSAEVSALRSQLIPVIKQVGQVLEGGKLAEGDQRVYEQLGPDLANPGELIQLAMNGDHVAQRKLDDLQGILERSFRSQAQVAGLDEPGIQRALGREESPAAQQTTVRIRVKAGPNSGKVFRVERDGLRRYPSDSYDILGDGS